MSLKIVLLLLTIAASAGIAFGYFLRWIISLGQKGSVELDIKEKLLNTEEQAKKITNEAENKAEQIINEARIEIKEREEKIKKSEDRIIKKEDFLDKRQLDIDKEIEAVKEKISEVRGLKEKTEELLNERLEALQKISKLSKEEAKSELLKEIEKEAEEDALSIVRKFEMHASEIMEEKAKEILASSIQRLASSVPSEIMATAVSIPSEEVKGKIIGKEGRNIKAFERSTGVEIIIDDTPGSITLSSFDP